MSAESFYVSFSLIGRDLHEHWKIQNGFPLDPRPFLEHTNYFPLGQTITKGFKGTQIITKKFKYKFKIIKVNLQ